MGADAAALACLTDVLNYMEAHSIRRERVDWPTVRMVALECAADAQTVRDTYPAIRSALAAIGERHSGFHTPEMWREFRASSPRTDVPPSGRRIADDIGAVLLTATNAIVNSDRATEYATTVQNAIRDADSKYIRGWVVDLRRNTGGNMYPMLAGVGPVLGEGETGGFLSAAGMRTPYGYRNGEAFCGGHVNTKVETPYRLHCEMPPVAVLTSAVTVSSGEFVLLAFRGRPATRTFGQATAGMPTGNELKPMPDGAILRFTTTLGLDRTGRVYDDPIPPDEEISADGQPADTNDDPVLAAAMRWLRQQRGT